MKNGATTKHYIQLQHLQVKYYLQKPIWNIVFNRIGIVFFFYAYSNEKKTFIKTNYILIYLIHNYFNNLLGWLDGSKNNLDDSQLIQY